MVSQGYIVVAPDYRGSTGYGKSFYRAIDYGGLENEDVLAARDYAMTTIPMLREEEREEATNVLNEYFEDPAALLEEIREQKELLEE